MLGGGPAGMATALSVHQAGHEVVIFERYPEARPAGNVLNLWPPPVKALGLMAHNLGAPCESQFRNHKGRVRAVVKAAPEIVEQYGRGGGFIGLLRPELYERMLAALPPGVLRTNQLVERIEQDDRAVTLHFADGTTHEADVLVGADGIGSLVRTTLWGETRSGSTGCTPSRASPSTRRSRPNGVCGPRSLAHRPGQLHLHPEQGPRRVPVVGARGRRPRATAPADLLARARELAAEFVAPLPQLVEATRPEAVQRWVLRDRGYLEQWSKGRVTLAGDAAHATSPYAAYGAGMAIEDGFFIGRALRGVDLTDSAAVRAALQSFEEPRKPHVNFQVRMAWENGQRFHHAPRFVRPIRDFVFDHTPFLQRIVGDTNPREIYKQLALIVD